MAPRKSTGKAKSVSAARAESPAASPAPSPAKKGAKKAASPSATKKTTVNINIKPARYYAQIPASLRSKAKPAKKGIFSQIASSIFGGNKRRGPADNSKVRDFPYMTAAGPQFFCTDKKASQKQFGVSHNDRLLYKYGPFAGTYCSVLGTRGGHLWVVNDASKKNSDSGIARPQFIEKDLSGAFDNGFATPLYGCESGADLEEAGLNYVVKGGMLDQADVDDLPSPLVNFLRYAPDLTLTIPQTNDTLVIPPILTPTGEVGWSSADAFNAFAPEGVDTPTEARVLVSVVPLLIPVEYLSDDEAEASE